MPYVQRDAGNAICGAYAQPQPGYAEEWISNDDPALVAFLSPPPTVDQLRIAALKANARRQALVTAINNTDDAGILAYINNNVTDLASAKVMLGNLALLVAAVIRS